eukprot:COSAG01_NODE_7530_length_3164_cov_21.004241_2_plen_54_part_00
MTSVKQSRIDMRNVSLIVVNESLVSFSQVSVKDPILGILTATHPGGWVPCATV